jgi:hypothetical protein
MDNEKIKKMFKEQYGSLLNIKEIDKNNISIINNEI